jgi:hypothetical protein
MNPHMTHFHVTLTLPGSLRRLLFERTFPARDLVSVAAGALRRHLCDAAGVNPAEWTGGMVGAAHACGNGLNHNPHVHLVATRELVHRETGEIADPRFVPYAPARVKWMKAVLAMLVRRGFLSGEEAAGFTDRYPGGFHVHFKTIRGNENDVLFKTAEYIASGFFHNSQITAVNHAKKTVSFRFRRMIDPHTKEKLYAVQTLPVYEFMARILFYLPEKHRKSVRYYGIYARGIEEKLDAIRKKTWAYAIEHCFHTDPKRCPRCHDCMIEQVKYSFEASRAMKKITATHYLYKGYFIPRRGP